MATKKVTQLTTATSAADLDLVMIVDVDDTAMSPEGTNKQITKANLFSGGQYFTVNSAGYLSQIAERALSFVTLTEDTSFSYATSFAIPKDCRLVSVTSASQYDGGATDLSAYKPTSDALVSTFTALGTIQVASHTAAGTHTSTFDSSTYDYVVGDRFGLTVSSVTNLGGFRFTCLFKTI
tara:strand:- start:1038 stop:1577 length:540 start_codon:yes stop_codon:yes gene_type:complete